MLTLAMLVGTASPVQAAGKATIKTVSGIKFQKAKGADKTTFSYLAGSVNNGTYIMFLKDAENGKPYLLSTKDGKKYTQTDLKAAVKKMGVLSKKNADSLWFGSISVLDKEVALCGSYGEEKAFMLTTKERF